MTFRRAAKVDANQPEIVAAFRKLGCSVLIISQLKNCCDVFISKGGVTVAVEIKDGTLPPSKRKLTEGEERFSREWKGDYCVVESIQDAVDLVRVMSLREAR